MERVIRAERRASSVFPRVATEMVCWARLMVTASRVGSSARAFATERATQPVDSLLFCALGGSVSAIFQCIFSDFSAKDKLLRAHLGTSSEGKCLNNESVSPDWPRLLRDL